MIRSLRLLKNHPGKEVSRIPFDEINKAMPLVSKGSNFLSKLNSQYLRDGVLLKKKPKNKMEMEYNAAKLDFMSPASLYDHNEESNSRIVAALKLITPLDLCVRPYYEAHSTYFELFRRNKTVFSDLPPIPSVLTTELFKEYIQKMTTTTFVKNNASNINVGLVRPLLKSLFRTENRKLRYLRDIDSYNMVILFFLKQNDVEYARSLMKQMILDDRIQPNTKTYNSFLYQLIVPRKGFTVNPSLNAAWLLEEMQAKNLKADLATWYIILKICQKDVLFTKDLFELYYDFQLPNTAQLVTIKMETNFKSMSSKEMENMSCDLQNPMHHPLVELILAKFIEERNFNEAWRYLKAKAGDPFSGRRYEPNSGTLQIFLEAFQRKELIHLSLGAFYTFIRDYNIVPSPSNFYSLFLATTKRGYHKNWREMARIIFSEMIKFQKGVERNKCGYWITRLQLRAVTDNAHHFKKIDFDSPLTPYELELLEQIKSKLVWRDTVIGNPFDSGDETLINLCKLVGYISRNHDLENSKITPEQRSKREKYKMRQKLKNYNLNYLHRSRIAIKGPLNYLVDELKERKIVEDKYTLIDLGMTEENNKKQPNFLTNEDAYSLVGESRARKTEIPSPKIFNFMKIPDSDTTGLQRRETEIDSENVEKDPLS